MRDKRGRKQDETQERNAAGEKEKTIKKTNEEKSERKTYICKTMEHEAPEEKERERKERDAAEDYKEGTEERN